MLILSPLCQRCSVPRGVVGFQGKTCGDQLEDMRLIEIETGFVR